MLTLLKKIIPPFIFRFFQPAYHYIIAFMGAFKYGFPSRHLYVVAITGTKGKSSTTELVNKILEDAGFNTAVAGTIRFKIGDVNKPNLFKMSMPGRFFMQKFLFDAVKAGCTHAVIEMTSEGAKQFRHKWIQLDALIFTNLSPEHIESHGSFERYKQAKLNIAQSLEDSKKLKPTIFVNIDDKAAEDFLKVKAEKITYSLKNAEPYIVHPTNIDFTWRGESIISPLRGVFNLYNIIAAATFAEYIHVPIESIKKTLERFGDIKGRVQKIDEGQKFGVFVDYAHTQDSLEQLYKAFDTTLKVCVLGNTGGGRDKWKRPEMAKIADTYCDHIILTNEDPYDEDPMQIINEMLPGITKKSHHVTLDRREAIKSAFTLADNWAQQEEVSVLITGKGSDPYIMVANDKKIPWSDEDVAREELKKMMNK